MFLLLVNFILYSVLCEFLSYCIFPSYNSLELYIVKDKIKVVNLFLILIKISKSPLFFYLGLRSSKTNSYILDTYY